jgi:hypothetical protein
VWRRIVSRFRRKLPPPNDAKRAAELAQSYGLLTETAVLRSNGSKVWVQLDWTLDQLHHVEFLVYLWEQGLIGGPEG